MAVETLVDLFTTAVRDYPRADMFAYKRDGEWQRVSSDETLAAVKELTEGLASLGLKEGEHIAILSQNRLRVGSGRSGDPTPQGSGGHPLPHSLAQPG